MRPRTSSISREQSHRPDHACQWVTSMTFSGDEVLLRQLSMITVFCLLKSLQPQARSLSHTRPMSFVEYPQLSSTQTRGIDLHPGAAVKSIEGSGRSHGEQLRQSSAIQTPNSEGTARRRSSCAMGRQ